MDGLKLEILKKGIRIDGLELEIKKVIRIDEL